MRGSALCFSTQGMPGYARGRQEWGLRCPWVGSACQPFNDNAMWSEWVGATAGSPDTAVCGVHQARCCRLFCGILPGCCSCGTRNMEQGRTGGRWLCESTKDFPIQQIELLNRSHSVKTLLLLVLVFVCLGDAVPHEGVSDAVELLPNLCLGGPTAQEVVDDDTEPDPHPSLADKEVCDPELSLTMYHGKVVGVGVGVERGGNPMKVTHGHWCYPIFAPVTFQCMLAQNQYPMP